MKGGGSRADSEQVSRKTYRRLTRYAVISAVHFVFVVAAVVNLLAHWAWAPSLTLAALVLLIWSTGHYQADVSLNPALDEIDRRRWRMALWCVLWSMSVYWLLYVRSQRAFDGRAAGAR